jgi:hypothetical protein
MTERLLDYNPVTGMKEWFSTDEDGNSFIRYEQDVSATLDCNKEQQADGFDKRSEMWHAARVPDVVAMEWLTKHGVWLHNPAHKEGVRRLLNSNEYRYLRVNNFIL